MIKNFFYIISISVICILFSACSDDGYNSENAATKAKNTVLANRTILVYIIGENSLSSYINSDLDEMETGIKSANPNSNLLVYVDGTSNPYLLHYYAKNGSAVCDTITKYSTNLCSTDPKTLYDVLTTVRTEYPAESYGLVLWSHGSGWLPADKKQNTRSIGIDNGKNSSANSGPEMDITDLRSTLEDFIATDSNKFDFIYFDACNMQSVEVDYELRNCTDYIIASPGLTSAFGAPYDIEIPLMMAKTLDIKAITEGVYNYYEKTSNSGDWASISAVKTSELDNLLTTTKSMLTKLTSPQTVSLNSVFYYYDIDPYYFDFNSVMKSLLSTDDYNTWYQALTKAVLYPLSTDEIYYSTNDLYKNITDDYSGITVYIPYSTESSTWLNYYKNLDWGANAGFLNLSWSE